MAINEKVIQSALVAATFIVLGTAGFFSYKILYPQKESTSNTKLLVNVGKPANTNSTTTNNTNTSDTSGIGQEEFDALSSMQFDCNNNNIDDGQDITSGTSKDINKNGFPDECEFVPILPRDRIDDYKEVRLSIVDHTEPANNANLTAWPKMVKVFFKEPPSGCKQMSISTESTIAVPRANTAKASADGLMMELSTDGADTTLGGPYIVHYSVCQKGPVENPSPGASPMESNGSFGFNIILPK